MSNIPEYILCSISEGHMKCNLLDSILFRSMFMTGSM